MAGRAVLFNNNNECVFVAVGGYADNMLIVAAGFALEPKFLP